MKARKPKATIKKTSARTVTRIKNELQRLRRKNLVLENLRRKRVETKAQSGNLTVLAMGIAHEFNNILGAVDGHAEWALESQDPNDWKMSLEIIRQACERSSEITSALRSWGQPKEELKEMVSVPVLFKELEELLGPALTQKSIQFKFQSPDLFIYANRTEILEVLVNLVQNSMDALAGRNDGEVEVLASKTKRRCVFAVRDNGPGIPELYRERVFEPFFTLKGVLASFSVEGASSPKASVKGGSGLGLFLSRSIVEEHGGTLTLQPVDSGSVFEINLPLTEI